jgi:cyclopropane fatty-acyl-phospholipid synthase-like methyltransferase
VTGPAPPFPPSAIRAYYDRHTAAFVRFGQGGGALHRAVWSPGVRGRAQAFHVVEDRIVDLLRQETSGAAESHVVDLGCGVGASLCHVAARQPVRGTGITISREQAALGGRRVAELGLSGRLTIVEGDFCDPPSTLSPADLAYAIEAFVHSPSADRFFAGCARVVRAGGVLAICDDFTRPASGARAARAVARFRQGWRVNTLVGTDELRRCAAAAGFEHVSTTDLTPWLELDRPRDRASAALVPLLSVLPGAASRWAHLLGGSALQRCLANGWIGYELVVFRRRATPVSGLVRGPARP